MLRNTLSSTVSRVSFFSHVHPEHLYLQTETMLMPHFSRLKLAVSIKNGPFPPTPYSIKPCQGPLGGGLGCGIAARSRSWEGRRLKTEPGGR